MGSAKKCRVYSVLAERRRGNPPTDGTTQRTLDKHCRDSLQAAATPTGHKRQVIQAFTSASLAAVHSLSWIGGFWRELVQAQTDRQERHAETGE